ncbi:hypothetical protein M1M25_gp061 [Tenacibaculum phage Gundel_1]|uniref:Uncharacterized protein n=1 Tax=Tenacibaculum phage Gundel_1 TaxID=2745672 RepID=A0A8E5EBL8_9CAUD|nr:hypothetical protein M1M25_gp061 [Tenacibaculum phage Gundel_1]QQV91496.1 hypothetical protein Gundel1_61 [Tenacibaculum phage Gundel_1]
MGIKYKKIEKSKKYKYVYKVMDQHGNYFWAGKGKMKDTEREAALYVDKQLLEKGKEPVNILIRK